LGESQPQTEEFNAIRQYNNTSNIKQNKNFKIK